REIEVMEMNGGSFDDNAEQLKHEAALMGEISKLMGNKLPPENGDKSENGDNTEESEEKEDGKD
ncbi:MAG: hypothetical protein IKI97_05835, partial [Clostridia bacterium]|nr:hypothetical protein [Clostridia bacterium]